VFIILDELPTRSLLDEDGGMDAERFPNLAAFADDATWYRHHSALAPLTSAAVPSLLSGQLPTVDAPLFANHPDNLFTLLAPTHELEVFEAVTTLCPYESCVATRTDEDGQEEVIDAGTPGVGDLVDVTVDLWLDRLSLGPDEPALLDDYAEEEASVEPERSDIDLDDGDRGDLGVGEESVEATSVRAQAFMDTLDATKGPSLYYLHLMLPHQPWARHPDGEIYSVTDPVAMTLPADDKEIAFSWSDWIGAVSEQRHLLQAQYADELVGQIMDQLRAEGLYDDSLVVLTSDHGVSFEPRTSARYVTASTVDAIAYSPLLVKRPGQRDGAVDDTNVMAFDVMPTVAELVGVVPSWSMDGSVIGSPAIAARGGRKRIDDVSGLGDLSLDEVLEWDDADEAPRAQDRWIGPVADPSAPLSGLDRLLDARELLGTRLDDHDPGDGALRAHIDQVGLVRTPLDDIAPLGLVTGRVAGAPAGAEVVLAIDGVIVGGSKLSTDSDGNDGRIAVLLPQGALHDANEVRVALVVDGEVLELEVTG
jgi:hypothetical protein